jgi:cyclic pyranopterin monophosphate synthase
LSGMVDISGKNVVRRMAKAVGTIELGEEAMKALLDGEVRKGDVFEAAKIAAIQAVKLTPSLLAYCHPLPVEDVKVSFDFQERSITCSCAVTAHYRTGVEMEALTGVSVALLTIWDMVKYLEKDEGGQYPHTEIRSIRVVSKMKEE